MKRLMQRNLIEILVLGIFVAAIVASLDYSPRARLVPLTIATIGALLAIAQIVAQNLRADSDLHVDLLAVLTAKGKDTASSAQSSAATPPHGERKDPALERELMAFGLIGALLGLFVLFGPIPAILLFMASYFVATRQFPIFTAIPIAVACTALIYAIFALGLDVQFAPGLIDLSFGYL